MGWATVLRDHAVISAGAKTTVSPGIESEIQSLPIHFKNQENPEMPPQVRSTIACRSVASKTRTTKLVIRWRRPSQDPTKASLLSAESIGRPYGSLATESRIFWWLIQIPRRVSSRFSLCALYECVSTTPRSDSSFHWSLWRAVSFLPHFVNRSSKTASNSILNSNKILNASMFYETWAELPSNWFRPRITSDFRFPVATDAEKSMKRAKFYVGWSFNSRFFVWRDPILYQVF